VLNAFKTTTNAESPLDASTGTDPKQTVSDFLTVQSFTNFAAMTGAITAAWHGLQTLDKQASANWVPYAFALTWAIISVLISFEGLKKGTPAKFDWGTFVQAMFLALINGLVLGSAVVGTTEAAKI
jgi:hypothetical protein